MRDQFIPWSSILLAFAAGIVASLFFTPLIGLVAAPLGLFMAEFGRLKNRDEAIKSTKAYMIGWGWAFGARFTIGIDDDRLMDVMGLAVTHNKRTGSKVSPF